MNNLKKYIEVQEIAKKVLASLKKHISAEATEQSIVKNAKKLLAEFGAPDTWYHNVPAFVLLGSRSCLSISGRDYEPSDEKAGQTNLLTVDLSPKIGNVWGDCARSYVIENGVCTDTPTSKEFIEGLETERILHQKMKEFVTPQSTFSELFEFGNKLIKKHGYENLDFLANLGHSIEISSEKRRFIEKQCHVKLGDVAFFTFEPHIRKNGGRWGFKHENIYYFDEHGKVIEL